MYVLAFPQCNLGILTLNLIKYFSETLVKCHSFGGKEFY